MGSAPSRRARALTDSGRSRLLGATALLAVALAVLTVVATSKSSPSVPATIPTGPAPTHPQSQTGSTKSTATTRTLTSTSTQSAAPPKLALSTALGQMIITSFPGTVPTANLLARISDGDVGGVILFSDNTTGGVRGTAALVAQLQHAATAGRQPGLLIMTDQEGGEVKRLPGPPSYSAAQMTSATLAASQGKLTGQLLKQAGVNVDLAPVADVNHTANGFLALEQRTFGASPQDVAARACAFAAGLSASGVAPTFKHFPGLGFAVASTDTAPVTLNVSASTLRADDLAYRACGNGVASTPALVMISNAIYPTLTGTLPAVLSPEIYQKELPTIDGVHDVTVSDDLGAGALAHIPSVPAAAIAAGLDLLLFGADGSVSDHDYHMLLGKAEHDSVSQAKIQTAAAAILGLKARLGLTTR
jgi:beta-N-acetylhexosaminidase